MTGKIDEIQKNEKWKKERIISKKPTHEEERKQEKGCICVNPITVEKAIRIKVTPLRKGRPIRQGPLGGTGPKPWFDRYYQGGNAKPRNRRREHPSGYHNCG